MAADRRARRGGGGECGGPCGTGGRSVEVMVISGGIRLDPE
jgi:hypothetical protein